MDELEKLPLSKLKLLSEYNELPSSIKKSTLTVEKLRIAIFNYRIFRDKFTCKKIYKLNDEELINVIR